METAITVVLFGLLFTTALLVARQRNLFAATMLTGIFSLVSAGLFTVMEAVDVAFTEAAVGAGVSTVLMLATLSLTEDTERRESKVSWPALIVVLLTGGALIYGTLDMPAFGDANAAVHQPLSRYYIERSWDEIGLPNMVTSILASYRGADTFGELGVVFVAGISVILLLGHTRAAAAVAQAERDERPSVLSAERQAQVREMPVVRTVAKVMLPYIVLFAFYVQAHGDFGPGGGFQAGVILATAFILFGLVFGPKELTRLVPPQRLERVIPVGPMIYGGVGVVAMLMGGEFLAYGAFTPEHPSHGHHYGIFMVELGVGITVSAVMITIYTTFATRPRTTTPCAVLEPGEQPVPVGLAPEDVPELPEERAVPAEESAP
jgi:multicomponent Na+:H+ antiporter subunit B